MTTNNTINELIDEISLSFNELSVLLSGFPQSQQAKVIVSGYNFKDVVAHIYEWELFLIDSLKKIKNKSMIPHKLNVKKMNLEFYERNKNKSLNEILKDLMTNHVRLMAYLDSFDNSLLSLPDPYYPEKHTVYTLVQHCSSLHYPWAIKFLKKSLRANT